MYREYGVFKRRWQNMEKVLTFHLMKMRVGGDDYDVICLFRVS